MPSDGEGNGGSGDGAGWVFGVAGVQLAGFFGLGEFEFEGGDGVVDALFEAVELVGEAAEHFERVAVGFKGLVDGVGGGGAADAGGFGAGVLDGFARGLPGAFEDFVGALLGGDHEFVRVDLRFGFLLGAVDDDLGFLAGLFEHGVALGDQFAGLFERGGRGGAEAVDQVEQSLAIDDPAAAQAAAAAGEYGVFQLIDEFEEVDGSFPTGSAAQGRVAAGRIWPRARRRHWAARGRRRGGGGRRVRGCGWRR